MSFILLGILNAQATGGAVPFTDTTYEQLDSITTSSASTVTFSNLVTSYSSDFHSLMVRVYARTTQSAYSGGYSVLLNNDTTSTYAVQTIWQSHTLATRATRSTSTNGQLMAYINGNNTYGNNHSASLLMMADCFNTAKNKELLQFGGCAQQEDDTRIGVFGVNYQSSQAIDEIDIVCAGGATFTDNSRFDLYGIRNS